jgi:acetyl-CoA decarbonylase/synthase complex subunit gamma
MQGLIMNTIFKIHQDHNFILIALAIFIPLLILWNYTRQREFLFQASEISPKGQPLAAGSRPLDYIKAFLSWLFLFNKLFCVNPGLYYIGRRKNDSPLLVTCNNFLTVFLLARRIGDRSVCLLVIDTDGINVWCSAGEGKFSSSEIIDKAQRVGLIRKGQQVKMIVPKLCLPGVRLSDLRDAGIDPVIGPIYACRLPQYLDRGILEDRADDRINFGLQSRCFTALPTAFQFFFWFLGVYVVTFWFFDYSIIWVATALAFLYPILFPYLPGKLFAVKGISLGVIASVMAIAHYVVLGFNLQLILFWLLFTFATSIFAGLSFTGNSPVSNYDKVRAETAIFLPVVVLLYLLIIPVKLFL